MEVVHQVRLLLRRNVALRLRQPVILALELLWPVVIFLVVMAARNAIPPVAQPTCYYKAWALPSAGVVPFVQSMICNIDDCQNETEYEDIPSYNGSSVRELVENTMPLIMDHSITELVTSLPKGMRLMRVAVDALSGPDLSVLLDEGFPVTDLLKNTNQTRELLSSINMTDDEIELILESSIQLPQILEITSQSNFCDIVPELVEDTSNIFDKIRLHLCTMDEISRKDFFRQLKSQLDVKNIVQTMGLAMSELGRLDIGEILGNIGVLLANLQSSNIFHEDVFKMVAMVLDEVRFEQIDTKVIRHLIEDLEPLYRESEWAMLIQVLKDVKIPSMKGNSTIPRRIDAEENKTPSVSENESAVASENSASKERFNLQRNVANTFETLLSLADIGMDVLKFLPRNASIQAQNVLKYFTFFVDVADGIVPEIEKSLKRDDSMKFLDTFSDILGAAFLNIAEETKSKDQNINFCNAKEFQILLNSSDWNDIPALQRYACKISRFSERLPGPSDEMNVEKWRSSVNKMRNLINFDKYSEIHHNIAKWQNEMNGNTTTGFTTFKKSAMNEATIDDVISTIECTIQGLQGTNTPQAGEAKHIAGNYLSTIPHEISNKISNNKRKIFLNGISQAKEIINYARTNHMIFGQMNLTNFGMILTELDKVVNGVGAENFGHLLTVTSKEFLRFIPAVAFMVTDFSTNATARKGLPSLTSAFIQDLESFIWKSISPKMVEEFAKKPWSDNFCVDADVLEATQLHWKWLLCTDSSASFKIPLPSKSVTHKDLLSSSDLEFKPVNSFDAQVFSQILLRVSSGMSFTVKVISQFLHPVKGCDDTCGSEDVMLKKMCFLARLQNAKSVIEMPKKESDRHEENIKEEDNLLQQFQTLLPIDEHIIEGYASFMDVVRASAANNFTSWRDIVRLIVSGLRFLDSFDGKDHKLRPSLHVINSLVSLVKNRVSDAAQSSSEAIVEIQNVFPDSPLTQEVVKSFLPILPEVTSTLFWTALVPGKVLKLIDKSDKNISIIISTICNSSLTDYFYNPGLTSDEFERLDRVLCSHKYYDVFEEIFEDPDIQEIVFEAKSTDEVSWEDMHDNILEIVSLLQDLAERKKADISSFPPLARWQKMAMGIHSQVMNPAVMLYVLNSKFFYRFCSDNQSQNMSLHLKNFFTTDQEKSLYQGLCSMSTASFSAKLVEGVNDTFKNSETGNKGKNPDVASLSQKIIGVLFSMPEIKDIGKLFLGMDLYEDIDGGGSSEDHILQNGANRYKIMNATKRTFDMVDSVTRGGLSATILGSSIPEILQDFSTLILPSDGDSSIEQFFLNANKSNQLFRIFFNNNPEERRIETYVETMAEYFSKKDNSIKLKSLCNKFKNRLSTEYAHDFGDMACSQLPSKWTLKNFNKHQRNYTSLWTEIDMFLTEGAKNATQELYFRKRKAGFLNSVDKILISSIQVTDWSSFQMPSFYFSMMRAFVTNLENIHHSSLQETSCLTRSGQEAIQESVHKLLHSVSGAEFLSCGLLNKNISSFYSWVSESADLKQAFEKVARGSENGEECEHSWKWLLPLIDDLEALYKRLSQNMSEKELQQANNCLRNFKQSLLISSLQMHANVIKQAAKFLSTINTPAGHWKGIKEQIFQRISQHLPAFIKLSEIIPESSSIIPPSFEMEDTEIEEILREASINFNWHLRQGLSHTTLRKKICDDRDDPSVSTVFLRPPQMNLMTRAKFYSYICSPNVTQHLMQQLNQSYIKDKVREIQEKEFFSGQWLQALMGSSDILIDVGTHLVSSMTEIQVHNLFDIFHLFTRPHVIQNVYESLGKLILVLEPVFPGSSLIETLQQILDGLQAFKSLTQLTNFNFSYKVKDVFGDAAVDVLMNELHVDPEEVSSFLESEVSLNQFGSLGVEGVLKEAKVDAAEAEKTLEILSNAPNVISRLTNHLETVTTVMHPDVKKLFQNLDQGVQWLTTPEALSTGGQILCGKPLTSLSRKFMLLSPEDAENKIEERELFRLPTDFCRHGYKEIMKMRGGAILWGFLKPLFRGKILYAPKDYGPALTIISKVNETFNILEEQVHFVKAAAEGSTGLHYLQRKNETLQSLQKLLSSKAVSKFLGSPSWGAALSWLEAPSSSSLSLLHLVELVGNVTECISLDRFLGFDTEEELEAAAATLHDRREFIAAIVFMKEKHIDKRWTDGKQEKRLPKNVLYKIRMDIDNVPTTEYIKYRWWRPYPYDDFFEDLRYFRGFLQLQDTVDSAIIDLQTQRPGSSSEVKKYLQQFPYPCHQRDKFGTLLKGSMPAVMTISWVFIVAFLVRERVLDRELELDETLGVMGLRKSSGWLAWFVTGLCVLLVSVIGIVAVLKWGGITPNSDPVVLFLFVADFAVLLIAYCQLMSTFFSRASTAALLSVLLYVLSFFPFLLFVTWELDFLYWQKLLSCVLVSTSFCFGCLYLNRYEDQGQGVHWSNLWQSPVAEDRMNFGTTLVAMTLCSLLYFFLSWYIARITTGLKGRKPLAWYVLLKPPAIGDKKIENGFPDHNTKPRSIVEGIKDQTDAKRTTGISLSNVHALYSKKGSKEWRALSGLNLDLYEDQITALLGHNGAGKTTTIKILTGRKLPTAGKVSLYGYSIPEELAEARKLIGYAPQNNTLYDKLTVKEHLNLFARLKGILDTNIVKKEVDEMLDRLNLIEKQDECTETLSGGQRRRLCVGIAFVGGSKVVILDEPTSSVDPVARRKIWDLILSYKKGRTILFTTHHLDEADILSDRVAILHKGRMLCCGSPLELKGRFGSGYRLSILPAAEKSEHEERDSGRASSIAEYEEHVNVDCDGVMECIQTYVPDATLLENDGSHLVVSLPADPLTSKPLSEFFAHLEKCLHLWGFQSCSISSATLEEVFLTLCRLEDAKAAHNSDKFADISPFRLKKTTETTFIQKNDDCCKNCDNSMAIEMKEKDCPTTRRGFRFSAHLRCNQLNSLIKKRFWHTKRNWKALTSSIVMPCVFIALAMGLAVGRPQKAPDPSIELTPALYTSKDHKAISFFAWNETETNLGNTLLRILKANSSQNEICRQGDINCGHFYGNSRLTNAPSGRCLCEKECPATIRELTPSLQAPDQLLYNMSDISIPRYLLDSYLQFNEKRYGGWTLQKTESNDVAAKVWFENSGYHSAPSYLNSLNNAILKQKTHNTFAIRTWSHPLRLSVEQLGRETLLQRLGEVGIAFVFLIGLSLVPCTFSVYIVEERESEQKRLQMVTGALSPLLYWGAAFLWDLTIVLATSLVSAAIVGAFALPAFYQRENFRAVYTLIFLYGWATTPLTYLLSRFFREGSLAFMVIFTSHLFVGLVIMMSLVSLRMISVSKDVATILSTLQRFSLAFPQYSLVGGLTDLNENQIKTEIFEQFGQDVYVSPFSWTSLGPNFVALFVQGIVFFLLTVLLEILPLKHWSQRLLLSRKHMNQQQIDKNEDDPSKSLLQIQNISQVYNTKAGHRFAVDNLTLYIPQGECFGLVGANGAGKTTLFRLLIGEIQPTAGKIIFPGLQCDKKKKHQFLGYCPQKDALDGLLTPRQHLEIYGGLRGIHSSEVPKIIERSLKSLELDTHADRPVHKLSGGTKRKLCTAIATLGDPELVLLDEPTSGMDPATRRLVWKTISRATEAGRSVVLTSHSIEDCDVLCTRLGIMVNGKIACLDSPIKLKARFGTGYTLSFRVPENKEDWTSLLNFIHKENPSAHLQVHSGRRIEIALPDENITLSSLFCQLEDCAKLFGIEDLAIDPTTLDQVFVNFVRQQCDAIQERSMQPESEVTVPTKDTYLEMFCTTKL
ncbi:ATP-binding cassette sub-family A member 1 [Araneus ventricosus]|uniref:ATP-binding cassette sub-family A member 1 n=1 Tax=Araneus ventricosus TaxID=182803 RepID=A0A4Y2H7H8_ARAVE|nr:ATP-binding cassette sub-family A member 1 [Araneus ventricosus]